MKNAISRRQVLQGVGLATVAIALAGCGRDADTGSNNGYDQPAGQVPDQYHDRQRVVFWAAYESSFKAPLTKIVDGFNDSQKEIFVDLQFQADYNGIKQGLTRGLQSKIIPDVTWLNESDWQLFLYNNTLEPLDGYFGGDFQQSGFVKPFLDQGIKGGKLWWVSFNRSTPIFYYNKDAFRSAGLPDRGPATWSELQEWSSSVKNLSLNGRQPLMHGLDGTMSSWTFQSAAWDFNGNISDGLDITVNKGGALDAGNWLHDLIFQSKAAYLVADARPDFYSQRNLSFIYTTGQLTTVAKNAKFEVGVAAMPREKATDAGVPTGGAGMSILRFAPDSRKKAAFEFIKYACQPSVSAQWSIDTGYLPVVTASLQTSAMKSYLAGAPGYQTAVNQVAIARGSDDVIDAVPGSADAVVSSIQTLYGTNQAPGGILDQLAHDLTGLTDKVRDNINKWSA